MIRMNRMSGKMQEIQKKYANNQAKYTEEIQKLYAEEGVNPMGGCLWSLLPFPILIALYSIIRQPITHFMMLSQDVVTDLVNQVSAAGISLDNIAKIADDGTITMQAYGQINLIKVVSSQLPAAGDAIDGWIHVNYNFLGLDLASTPWSQIKGFQFSWASIGLILIPILAGVSQLFLSKISMSQQPDNPANASTKSMMYMMPLFSVYIGFMMPGALGVYWIAQSVFSLIQEVFMNKFYNKKLEEEENARYEARQADRQRRQEEAKRLQEERKQQTVKKQSLKEKQKAAQEAKAVKAAKAGRSTTEAGRVGDRPYARGRAYKADRYGD
jgi:YidC/Oxa1 family membrane protein insertase